MAGETWTPPEGWDRMTEPERADWRFERQAARDRADREGATRLDRALYRTDVTYAGDLDAVFGRGGADRGPALDLTIGDQTGRTPDDVAALKAEVIGAVDDVGLPELLPALLPKWAAAYVADHRRTQTGEAVDAGARVDAEAQLRAAFRREFGTVEGAALLGRTQAFVAAHGRLATLLRVGTLALDGEVMLAIARRVHTSGWGHDRPAPASTTPKFTTALTGGRS